MGQIIPPSLQRLHICDYRFFLEQCHEDTDSSDFEDEDMNDTDNDEDIWPENSYRSDMDSSDWEIGTSSKEEDMNDTTLQEILANLE
ncbi:hypothetical protein QN277_005645 [Acacia crassicarpa]|uniref:Uncharacterized protein n=1 Tax=Acacia crassicarpa TaxID=499986 RepID=A0AAE1MBE8_9FABA|nr:hypothetical protein QN277_005645 [Acacia crassicarpa]